MNLNHHLDLIEDFPLCLHGRQYTGTFIYSLVTRQYMSIQKQEEQIEEKVQGQKEELKEQQKETHTVQIRARIPAETNGKITVLVKEAVEKFKIIENRKAEVIRQSSKRNCFITWDNNVSGRTYHSKSLQDSRCQNTKELCGTQSCQRVQRSRTWPKT